MKISELAKKTGVAPSTIRYYIKEGLLPKPKVKRKNMAYYDESYIPKITAIKELQNTGINPYDLDELEKMGFIDGKDGFYSDEDIKIIEAGATLRKIGFTKEAGFDVKDLLFLKELVSRIAQEEVKIFLGKIGKRILKENLDKMVKEGVESINFLMGVLNRKFLRKMIEDTNK